METAQAELTDRQLEILERVVQRKAYKVIAAELDISETRVKQHVRAIKDRLDANSMPELVAHFHAISDGQPFTKEEGPKMEVPALPAEQADRFADDPGALQLADSMPMGLHAPWLGIEDASLGVEEPRVVPRVLDGDRAGLPRLLAIVGIVVGLLVVFVLALTTAGVLTEQLKGSGYAVVERK